MSRFKQELEKQNWIEEISNSEEKYMEIKR